MSGPLVNHLTEPIETDMIGCARCDSEGHANMTFLPLTLPVVSDSGEVVFSYWALCPTNGEPILMKVWDDSEKSEPSGSV